MSGQDGPGALPFRVTVLLAGGNWMPFHFRTVTEAADFMNRWAAASEEAECFKCLMADGQTVLGVVKRSAVIGMYLASNEPSVQERLVTAVERSVKDATDGEEWKG